MRIIIVLAFTCLLCGCRNDKVDDGYLCRYMFFPTGSNENAFWVEVKKNKTMEVTLGDMTWKCYTSIKHGKFPDKGIAWENIKEKDSIVMMPTDYEQLEDYASEARKRKSVNKFAEGISYDGMGHVLFIKEKYYFFELYDYDDKSVDNLIKKLKEISPINIRGSYGGTLQAN